MSSVQRRAPPRPQTVNTAIKASLPTPRPASPAPASRSSDTFTAARPTSLPSLTSPPPPPVAAAPSPATGAPLTPEQAAKKAADTLAGYRTQLAGGKKLEDLNIPDADQNVAVFASVLEQGGTPEAIWTSPELTDLYNKMKPEEQREVMSGAFSNHLRKNLLAQLKEQMEQAAAQVERAMHGG